MAAKGARIIFFLFGFSVAAFADTWAPSTDGKSIVTQAPATNVGIGLGTGTSQTVNARFQVSGGPVGSGAGLPIVFQAQSGASGFAGGNIVISSGQNGLNGANGSILFGIGGTLSATGGTLTNGERMRIDPTGKVGIGLNQPLVALDVTGAHVSGQGIFRASSTDHALIVANSASSGFLSGLRLTENNTIMWDITQNEGGNGNALSFGNGTKQLFKMLRSNGFVGVGDSYNPSVQLDVKGAHVSGAGIIRANSSDHALIVANAGSSAHESGLRLTQSGTVIWDIAQNESGSGNALTFSNGTSSLVKIQRTDGRVGIGMNYTPGVALDVMGTHVNGAGIIRANSANHALIVANAASNSFESGLRLSSNGTVMWDIHQNENANGNNLNINSSTKLAMSVSQATGNVAINGQPSSFNLDVTGSARVTGDMVVGSITTSSWKISPPDYVFEEDYRLSPLDTVHAFIRKHKHLPEIPSAKEMNSQGIDLAEMNLRLLKKVEELTLYAISQKQAMAEQDAKIARLEKLAGIHK